MSTPSFIPSLTLFTLIAVLLVAVIGYILFLRKRSNRHPVEKSSLAGKTMAPTHSEE
jgi:predicted exporter